MEHISMSYLVLCSVTHFTGTGCQLMMTHIFQLPMAHFEICQKKQSISHILSCQQSRCIYHYTHMKHKGKCVGL